MLFDWFTIVAQLLNFLVLIWLLKKFLYKPILKAIDTREQLIAKQIIDAQDTKNDAIKQLGEFKLKVAELEQNKQKILNDAFVAAESEKNKLMTEIRNEAEILRLKLNEAISNEQQTFGAELMRKARDEIFFVVRKLLEDLADATLEEQITVVFIRRLKNLNDAEKSKLVKALHKANNVTVKSSFIVSELNKKDFEEVLIGYCNSNIKVKFEVTPSLTVGIELVTPGYKVEWSVYDYLISLENLATELLSDKRVTYSGDQ